MLTNKALLGLERALCDGYFKTEDFEIIQKDVGSNLTELRILYRYDMSYVLDATFNNAKQEIITETETNGVAKMLGAMGSQIRRSRQEDPITITMRPEKASKANYQRPRSERTRRKLPRRITNAPVPSAPERRR